MFPFDREQWCEASVDGEVLDLAGPGVDRLDDDGTGAATAFAAAELGPGQPGLRADEGKQRRFRINGRRIELYAGAVDIEGQGGRRHLVECGRRRLHSRHCCFGAPVADQSLGRWRQRPGDKAAWVDHGQGGGRVSVADKLGSSAPPFEVALSSNSCKTEE